MVINYNLKYTKYKNKYLKLKKMIGGTLFKQLPEVKIDGQINSLSYNNKNGHLAIGTNNNTLIYDKNYKLINTLKKEKTTCPVNHVSYSGTHLVTSCDKNAIVYEISQNYKEINVCEGPVSIKTMSCAPAEKPIVPICYVNQEVLLWIPTETSMLRTVRKQLELKGDNPKQIGFINSISWKDLRFVTCSDSRVAIWTVSLPNNVSTVPISGSLIGKDFKLIAYVPHNYDSGDFIALVYENSSRILFYRCSDEFLDTNKRADFFIDTEHQKPKQYATSSDISGITLIVFHPTKKYLATCGTENKVNIWSFEEPDSEKEKQYKFLSKDLFKVIRTIPIDANSKITSIAFNDKDIAIGCNDGKLIIWQELVVSKK